MALINQNSIIGVTSITSPSASNVLTVHTNDTTERLRVTADGVSFSGTNASLDTSGNLTIAGVLTYEDVSNVDSVGIITAQSGIHVTGGSVGIGTNNPNAILHVEKDGTSQVLARFESNMGTNNNRSIALSSPTSDSGSQPFIFNTGNAYQFQTDDQVALHINYNRNIGIGTDAPQGKLDIWGNVVITDQDQGVYFSDPDSKAEYHQIYMSSSDNSLNLKTYSSSWGKRLTIDTTGNIGIGTDNPNVKLHLIGNTEGTASAGTRVDIARLVAESYSPTNSGGMTLGAIWHNTDVNQRRSYIQSSQNTDPGSTARDLLLNPDGGEVGIGTDNPEGQLHLNGTNRYVQTISAINGVTAGTTSGTIYRQQYTTDSTSRRMGFFGIKRSSGSGDQRAKFVMELCPDNSTNLGLSAPAANTTAFEFNHNGTILVKSGGGIDFSETADSSGTMTSELLDDYEEGTFTAVLRSHSTNTTTTGYDTSTNSNNATYTKVGRLVTVNMEWNNLHNDARAHVLRYIDGLPFTSWEHNRSTAAIGYQRGLYFRYASSPETTNMHHLYGHIEGNTTQVGLNASKGSSPYSGWPTTHDSSSSMYLRLSMQYYV